MGIKLGDAFLCTMRAGNSLFGLQQLEHELVTDALRTEQSIMRCNEQLTTLREMKAAIAFGDMTQFRQYASLVHHIRTIEDRRQMLRKYRKILEARWRWSLPVAFTTMVTNILLDRMDTYDEMSPKRTFLSTLVLTGEIPASWCETACLGEEFFNISGSLTVMILSFGHEKPEHYILASYPNLHTIRRG